MGVLEKFLNPAVLPFMIPIAAIVTAGVVAITRMVIAHRERMAKIEQGIDPDAARKRLAD